jgi:hypothetical protein
MSLQSKLHIDLSQGLVEVEGDAELVREVYRHLKDHLLSGAPPPGRAQPRTRDEAPPADSSGEGKAKPKRRASPRKKADSDSSSPGISADAPKLDRDLDTSKLAAFYGQYEPKNHPEKILVFLSFLTETLGIESPNTDQVYTCYVKANERVPKAFAQAFRDTSGRSFGYIDYKSPTDIRITTSGTNHFKFDLKKKAAE